MIPNIPNPQLIRNGIHVPGQYSQTWWRNKQGHQEPLSESHQCSQHAQKCIEVPAVEHQDQAKTISKLCRIHPNMWLWMLKFCVRYSSLWFARWTQQCLVVKKSEKLEIWLTFDHRIHAVVNEKKTYEFFLLSKLKVKMASILYFSDIEEFADSYNWFPNLYQGDIFQIKL